MHNNFPLKSREHAASRLCLDLRPAASIGNLVLLSLFFFAPALGAVQRQVLQGHVPLVVPQLTALSSLGKTNRLNLVLGLPLPNRDALTGFIAELYDPSSPRYKQYLTAEQFTSMFGPTEQDYEALADFANSNGFTVVARHDNRLLLNVNASVEAIEKAFHLRMMVYQHPTESRSFFAPDVEPTLDLNTAVVFIGGLNNYVLPRPTHVQMSGTPQPNVGSAPDGSYIGNDFRNAYAPGVPLTGAGQTVALVEFDGFYQSDITAYENMAGLPHVPIETILLDGYDGIPSTTIGNIEVSLDLEMVISMAPGISKILVYEAGPGGIPQNILSRIANDNLAKQISSSWTWQPYDPSSEAIFLQFAAQGQTYFNATGDHCAFVGPINQAPSDNPYIVQVGGTSLTMNGSGESYSSETVWNRGNSIGSSGGISTTYPIPSWQQGVSMSANMGSTTMRNVPDVAMIAEGIHVKYGNGSSGSFGGTSCAAPLWAGFAALMNQQAVASASPTVGFLNPALYHIGTNSMYNSCFHDITVGNNTSSNSPESFPATAGYDLCTGLGTPTGSNLINAIVGPPVLRPLVLSNSFTLVAENCANNTIDPGETVSLTIGLINLGLSSTSNLVATLQPTSGIVSLSSPQTYGVLTGGGAAVTRVFAFVATGACGETNTATLQLQDGTDNLGTVTFSFMLGQRSLAPVLSQNFDSVISPALPTGWTVSWTGAGAAWATTSALCETSPNSAFARNPALPSDNSLISPPFAVASSSAQLTFRHNFYTETLYDGGALEISIAGGPFTDILAAGGSFLTNGYTQIISSCCGNPLANRGAWTGSSGGFVPTIVNLPASVAGQTIRLRWRFCSDNMIAATGWYLDTVSLFDGFVCCTAIQPLIQSINRSNDSVWISWSSVSNRSYRLQSTTNVASSTWLDVPGDVTAGGISAIKSDAVDQSLQKFYRVLLLP